MGRLLSLQEVEKRLGVGRYTIMGLVRRGELPGMKIGQRWRFDEEDVEQYLRRAKQQQQEEPIEGQISLLDYLS